MGVERKANGKFQARYTVNGVRKTVGTFKSKSEAKRALVIARANDPKIEPDLFTNKNINPKGFLVTPIPNQIGGVTPTFTERISQWSGQLKQKLEKRNLL